MKISYLSDSTVPSESANSVHVVKMCSALAQEHDVSLHCYSAAGTNDSEMCAYYGVTKSFRRVRIPTSRLPGLRRIIRSLSALRALRSGDRPDLIYARDVYSLAAVSLLSVPLILELHVPPRDMVERLAIGFLIRRHNLLRLVVISTALQRELLRQYPSLTPERVLVAHDAADIADVHPPAVLPSCRTRTAALQLGYVGSLHPGKGAEVVANLARKLPGYDFHIVGGDQHSINRLAAAGHPENLFFHGHVPHAEVGWHLSQFDIVLFPIQENVVLPSGTDIGRWTSPLKLFEYMAAGKPIIGSDLSIVREVLSHRVNALLVDPKDLDRWADAIGTLEGDNSLRAQIGMRARDDLVQRYTWSSRARSVVAGTDAIGDGVR